MKNLLPLITDYLHETALERRPATVLAYRRKLGSLLDWAGGRSVGDVLCPAGLTAYRKHLLERPLAKATQKTTFQTARGFARWAYVRGHVAADPLRGVRGIAAGPHHPKHISADIAHRMVEAAGRNPHPAFAARDRALLYCLRDTGGRVGGILGMCIPDLDLTNGRCLVDEKGGRPHQLHLSAPTVTAIRQWMRLRLDLQPEGDHLWVGKGGRPLAPGGLTAALHRIAQRAGCPGQRYNPHAWRHAFARETLLAGADLTQVRDLMGHTRITVTADYYGRWELTDLSTAHRRYGPGSRLPDPQDPPAE